MRLVRSTLLDRGVPPARIRYEVFGPDLWAAQAAPGFRQMTGDLILLGLDQSAAVVERVSLHPSNENHLLSTEMRDVAK
jgi:ferredoxin-NADP reductase